MKYTIENSRGTIIYSESFFLGRRSITINGKPMTKVNKRLFTSDDGRVKISITGNLFTGEKLLINNIDEISVIPPCKWYEIVITVFTMAFLIIWGNSVTLVRIIPLVGGVVGGAISGLFSALGLAFMRMVKHPAAKIGIGVGAFAVAFLCCFIIALIILYGFSWV